jgi:hypothetical protein
MNDVYVVVEVLPDIKKLDTFAYPTNVCGIYDNMQKAIDGMKKFIEYYYPFADWDKDKIEISYIQERQWEINPISNEVPKYNIIQIEVQ